MFDFNKILSESDNSIQIKTNTIGSKIALETIDKSSDLIHNINEDFSVLVKDLSAIRYNISKDIMRSNIVSDMYAESSDITQPFTVDAYNYTFDRTNKYPTFNPLIELLEETYTDIIEKDRREIYRGDTNRRESLYKILKESAVQLIELSKNATSAVNGGAKSINEDNFIYRTYSSYRGGKETLPYKITVTPHMIQNVPEFAETMTEGVELYDKAFNKTTRLVSKLIESVQDIAPDYVTILKESVVDYINCANIAYAIKADAIAEYIGTFFNESGYSRETNTELSFSQIESRSMSHDFYDGIFNESEDFDDDDYNILKSMDEVAYIPMLEDMKGAYINYLGTKMSETLIGIHEADEEGGFFLVRWWNKLVDWVKGIFEKESENTVGSNSKAAQNVNWISQNEELIMRIAKERPGGSVNLYDISGDDGMSYDDNDTPSSPKTPPLAKTPEEQEAHRKQEYINQLRINYGDDLKEQINRESASILFEAEFKNMSVEKSLGLVRNTFDALKDKLDAITDEESKKQVIDEFDRILSGSETKSDSYDIEDKIENYQTKTIQLTNTNDLSKIISNMKRIDSIKKEYDACANIIKVSGDKMVAKLEEGQKKDTAAVINSFIVELNKIKGQYNQIVTSKQALDNFKNGLKTANSNFKGSGAKDAEKGKALSAINSQINTYNGKVEAHNRLITSFIEALNNMELSEHDDAKLNEKGNKAINDAIKKLYNLVKPESKIDADGNGGFSENPDSIKDFGQKNKLNRPGITQQENGLLQLVEANTGSADTNNVTSDTKGWDDTINACKSSIEEAFKKTNVFIATDNQINCYRECIQHANKTAQSIIRVFADRVNKNVSEFKSLVEMYNNEIEKAKQQRSNDLARQANEIADKGNPAIGPDES